MKKIITAALVATAGLTFSAGAVDAKQNTDCQRLGMSVLKDVGLLQTVAQEGLEYPIGSGEIIPFSTVLSIHRNDPATANVVLKDYAVLLDIASPEVVAAVDSACPTG